VDDHTAVLHLDRTLTNYQNWDYLLPEHLEAPIRAQGGTQLDYINRTQYNSAPTTPGLWNGPYVVSNYQSGNSVELTPNPFWAGPAPAIKRVVIRLVDNTAALQANLLSGDVDMTPSGIGITTDQAVSMQQGHANDFVFIYKPGLSYERIDLKRENPILADLRVRQALLLSIDRKTLADRLFTGHAKLALSWINEIEPNFTTDVPHYKFDPPAARALLKEAGWTPGSDGICRNAAGDRLSLEFATTSGNRIRELSQQVMQNQWKAVCIEVSIKNQPSRTFFGELTRKRSYTGLAEYANSTRVGLVPTPFLSGAATPTEANNFTGMNWTGFANARMDAVMAQAETELDPAKQKALWAEMQKIYATELPELPLYFREDPDVVPTWLQGYEANGKEDYVSYWAEKWH
jgi:peptide/nickel transport system substrate-binding protein